MSFRHVITQMSYELQVEHVQKTDDLGLVCQLQL